MRNNFFSNNSGISDHQDILKNPLYFYKEKNKQLFEIKINPKEYLKIIEDLAITEHGDYHFTPDKKQLKNLQIEIDKGEKIDCPWIYEKMANSFNNDSSYYTQGHEGRHRSTLAIENNLKEINIFYTKDTDICSKVGLGEYIKIQLIEQYLKFEDNKDNTKEFEDIKTLLNFNNIEFIDVSTNTKNLILLNGENKREGIIIDVNTKEKIIKPDNKLYSNYQNVNIRKAKELFEQKQDKDFNLNNKINEAIDVSKELLKEYFTLPIDFKVKDKIYFNNQLGGYNQDNIYINKSIIKILLNEQGFETDSLNDLEILEKFKNDINIYILEDILTDTILHEYGHLIMDNLEEFGLEDKVYDLKHKYEFEYTKEEFKKYVFEMDEDFIYDYEYILDERFSNRFPEEDISEYKYKEKEKKVKEYDFEKYQEYYEEEHLNNFIEEIIVEKFVDFIRSNENDLNYSKLIKPLSVNENNFFNEFKEMLSNNIKKLDLTI